MNGRSHTSTCDLVRYLDRSIKIDFQEIRRDLEEVNFRCERGLFAEAGMSVTNSWGTLHMLEEVWAVLLSGRWRIAELWAREANAAG